MMPGRAMVEPPSTPGVRRAEHRADRRAPGVLESKQSALKEQQYHDQPGAGDHTIILQRETPCLKDNDTICVGRPCSQSSAMWTFHGSVEGRPDIRIAQNQIQ